MLPVPCGRLRDTVFLECSGAFRDLQERWWVMKRMILAGLAVTGGSLCRGRFVGLGWRNGRQSGTASIAGNTRITAHMPSQGWFGATTLCSLALRRHWVEFALCRAGAERDRRRIPIVILPKTALPVLSSPRAQGSLTLCRKPFTLKGLKDFL